MEFTEFLDRVARHSAILLMVLPLIGALLTRMLAGMGDEVVRRTALTNVLLSIAAASILLVRFQPESLDEAVRAPLGHYQMAGAVVLEPGEKSREAGTETVAPTTKSNEHQESMSPLLQLAVGVNGVNLWLLVLIPVVMLPAVRAAGRREKNAMLLALLLLLQAALTGVVASINVLMLLMCWEASGILLFLLIGRWGTPDHRRESVPLGAGQIAGSLLLFFGVLGAVVVHQWLGSAQVGRSEDFEFLIPRLAVGLRENTEPDMPGHVFWQSVEPMIFTALVLGLMVKSAIFPFHSRFCARDDLWPAPIAVLAYGIVPCLGVVVYLQLVVPLCPAAAALFAPLVMSIMLIGALYCALLALSQSELKDVIACSSAAHIGLAFAAAATLEPTGMTGTLFHVIGHAAGVPLLILVAGYLKKRYSTLELKAFGGLAGILPVVSVLYFVATFALIGIPGLAGFPATWLTLSGFVRIGSTTDGNLHGAVACLAVGLVLAWVLLWTGQRLFFGRRFEPKMELDAVTFQFGDSTSRSSASLTSPVQQSDAAKTQGCLSAVPLITILLAVGLAPRFVIERSQGTLYSTASDEYRSTTGGTIRQRESPTDSTAEVQRKEHRP